MCFDLTSSCDILQQQESESVDVPLPKYSPKKGCKKDNFDKNCFVPWLYCANQISLKRQDEVVMTEVNRVLEELKDGCDKGVRDLEKSAETQRYIEFVGGQQAFDDIMQNMLVPV